ncbi:PhzF family phenazine biosynthesis protein [Aneurinibacillus tyrosinisolvens]|uniref:PhzF family phenazine biosynthesis protein n=1 Tax=Aneurinibacillus tyrosinisolvens TaxID=1443435 RepID=UPI00063FC5D3|nr:PhzF family phenazine biosynthesis protein [Aneurinibacillus tyrosinisolvens]
MDVQVYTLNAFAKEKHGGNPAGVVLDADSMLEEEMQKVAQKIGFSETAFVEKSSHADFKVRFFTPNHEVDLCGHATIATFYLMVSQKLIRYGTYTLETKAGVLEVNVKEDGNVFLTQALPQFYEEINKQIIADSLLISSDELVYDLPIRIVSTGLRDILVPIRNIDVLDKINPDFNQIIEISKKYDVIGYHLFTLDTQTNAIARCRNFAPLFSIPEESATGTANGALSCYLYKHGKIASNQADQLIFEQGYIMKSPSEILARLSVNEKKDITKVEVGGTASNIQVQKVKI